MNGAQALIRTLTEAGIDVCFTNPGTSEMHFVAALDSVPEMRPVLVLFEGVASGAADGFARMTGRPASTLLHLGPGLSNALANVHNARRAHSPMLNVIGDHARSHRAFDAPLASDIAGLARPLSDWVRSADHSETLVQDALDAVRVARTPPGRIASLILPADVSWSPWNTAPTIGAQPSAASPPAAASVDEAAIAHCAAVLERGEPSVLLMNGAALSERSLMAAELIARKTGVRLFTDTFTGRTPRGAGRPLLSRLGYFAEQALRDLLGTRHLIVVGTKAPVAFFAYPDQPGSLVPEGCEVHALAAPEQDCADALERLAERVRTRHGATSSGFTQLVRPALPSGALSSRAVGAAIGALMPEHAIIVDEGNTEGFATGLATLNGPPHDWLHNTGGSIGLGLPLAVGAAVACPDRKVICLEGDGSAMYTNQALWTMAREQLDVTVIVFANRSYRILSIELGRVGAASSAGPRAHDLLSLTRPELDFVALANSMGVRASRPDDAAALNRELERALREPGPHLIECRV